MKKLSQLPDKPSELLEVAVKDLQELLKQPDKYQLDMQNWVMKDHLNGVCNICLAGAVMLKHFDVAASLEEHGAIITESFEVEDEEKFMFLNAIRRGNYASAFQYIDNNFNCRHEKYVAALEELNKIEEPEFHVRKATPEMLNYWKEIIKVLRRHNL